MPSIDCESNTCSSDIRSRQCSSNIWHLYTCYSINYKQNYPPSPSSTTQIHDSKYESCWSMIIAFRKHITSRGLRTLCDGPDWTPEIQTCAVEIWKCYWPTYLPTSFHIFIVHKILKLVEYSKKHPTLQRWSYLWAWLRYCCCKNPEEHICLHSTVCQHIEWKYYHTSSHDHMPLLKLIFSHLWSQLQIGAWRWVSGQRGRILQQLIASEVCQAF